MQVLAFSDLHGDASTLKLLRDTKLEMLRQNSCKKTLVWIHENYKNKSFSICATICQKGSGTRTISEIARDVVLLSKDYEALA